MDSVSTRLSLVFLAALVARLAFFYAGPFQDPSRAIFEDSTHYQQLAANLAGEGRFGVRPDQQSGMQAVLNRARDVAGDAPRAESGLAPESFRTPGYPAFLAVASLVTGDVRLVLLLQCLLGSLGAVMVAVLAGRLRFKGWIPVAAGLVWALHPALVTYDNLVLTESTFLFCTLAAYVLATSRRPVPGVLAAAALLGVATLIRPPLGFVFLPGVIALAWSQLPSRPAPYSPQSLSSLARRPDCGPFEMRPPARAFASARSETCRSCSTPLPAPYPRPAARTATAAIRSAGPRSRPGCGSSSARATTSLPWRGGTR